MSETGHTEIIATTSDMRSTTREDNMSLIRGTFNKVRFCRVVDGDTIRVSLNPGDEKEESLRILCLDTEESYAGGSKPVSPLGHLAKERAEQFFQGADEVTIEFPGNEPWDICLTKYRGNYGRLLVYVYRDDVDFQEMMIAEGFSPYFTKYGHASFTGHHVRYINAERAAQIAHLGIWDQVKNNHAEIRNYAALTTWWKLRARVIDDFRRLKARDPSLLDSRLDHEEILRLARKNEVATVFTELSTIDSVGNRGGLIRLGSMERPFNLYIPDITSQTGQEIAHLATNRYISDGEDHPRQSYAFVTGPLSLYRDSPQIILESASQIADRMDRNYSSKPAIRISSVAPDPLGLESGREIFTLRNLGDIPANLEGWTIWDAANHIQNLSGTLPPRSECQIQAEVPLNNNGDTLYLKLPDDQIADMVQFEKEDVAAGKEIKFLV